MMNNDKLQHGEIVVDDKLSFIQKVINTGDYDVAVKESCLVFEIAFRKIFQQAIVSLPYQDRAEILEIEKRIGEGKKGVQDFTFGQLVGLFRESKLMDKWSKYTSKDLGLIKSLDYSSIVSLRNRITHRGGTCTPGEANIVYEYLRNLLAELGLADLDVTINHSFRQKMDQVSTPAEDITRPTLEERLPKRQKMKGRSYYSSSYGEEKERLKIQSEIMRPVDITAFNYVIEKLENRNDLTAIDVGAAAGDVTIDRFSHYSNFKKVIGVDINQQKIEEAYEKEFDSQIFSFHLLDVESPDFDEKMSALLAENGLEQVDIIFSALTLHHLANPYKAIFKLRKYLKKGGYIVLRGSDDGSKLAYPDEENIVASIMKLSLEIEGKSDRENGRKLFHQVKKSGFSEIKLFYNLVDTTKMGPEERLALYHQSFSYRKNPFKRRLEQNPNDPALLEEYKWITEALEELELMFTDDSFYYIETHTVAVGKK